MLYNLPDAEAIFFDLDDTLYDQLLPFQSALKYAKLQIDPANYEVIYKRVRFYSDLLWKSYTKGELTLEQVRSERLKCALREFEIDLSNEQAIEIQERYQYEQKVIELFPHVKSIIKELQNQDKVVGIITNGPVEHQMSKIIALQLDRIISNELIFISDGICLTKPDKRVFEYVQKQVKISAGKCLYIGDTWENDIAPPIEAGWKSIWFNYRNRKPQSHHQPSLVIKEYDKIIKKILSR